MDYAAMKANYIAGTPYLGASVNMKPHEAGNQGLLLGWDIPNGKAAWIDPEPPWPLHSGILSTAGDVVFFGTMDRMFKAVDAHTGKELWHCQLGSGIVSNPITYLGPDGKQYIAIYSGIGGWLGGEALPDISNTDPTAALGAIGAMRGLKGYTAPGSTLYIFSL